MPRRGENIYKRKDGRWEGRFKPCGFSQKYKYVYASTYKEAKEKPVELKINKPSDNNKKILIVVECKKEDINERQFQIAVDQAYTYAHALAGKEEQNNSYT